MMDIVEAALVALLYLPFLLVPFGLLMGVAFLEARRRK
jgi:hypothetical protein